MSLINCLRTIDPEDVEEGKVNDLKDNKKLNFKMCLRRVERTWSDNLAQTWSGDLTPNFKPKKSFRKMRSRSSLGSISKSKKSRLLHRFHKGGSGLGASFESAPSTPRLVRCSGMRRDWSFEDLQRALQT